MLLELEDTVEVMGLVPFVVFCCSLYRLGFFWLQVTDYPKSGINELIYCLKKSAGGAAQGLISNSPAPPQTQVLFMFPHCWLQLAEVCPPVSR